MAVTPTFQYCTAFNTELLSCSQLIEKSTNRIYKHSAFKQRANENLKIKFKATHDLQKLVITQYREKCLMSTYIIIQTAMQM